MIDALITGRLAADLKPGTRAEWFRRPHENFRGSLTGVSRAIARAREEA